MDSAIVSGITYSVGKPRNISELVASEGADSKIVTMLEARGLQRFCEEARPMDEVLWEVASVSLESSGNTVRDVDGILIVNSPINEEVLVKTLNIAGFERAWLLGLSFQDCCGAEGALRLAGDLVQGTGRSKNLLILLYGKVGLDEKRVGWNGETVFSDGAAACVVSSRGAGFQILASEVLTSPKLLWLRDVGAHKQYLEQCLSSLSSVCNQALRNAGIGADQVECVFATNGSRSYHNIIATAVGVPNNKIYSGDLPALGHVFSCDGLIGLKNYTSQQECRSGECYMLVSWSPYVMSAAVLRKT
jgi:hypothetical protein